MSIKTVNWQHRVSEAGWLVPDWPAPANVRAVATTRSGGVSIAPFDGLNLGDHVNDDPANVIKNRRILRDTLQLTHEPAWLQQVHGVEVYDCAASAGEVAEVPTADAAVSSQTQPAAVVMTADCLPVLFCDRSGSRIAAAHAGWRGLCNGVLEQTVQRMACVPEDLLVWLGPAIGPEAFEVGAEVRAAFMQHDTAAAAAFKPGGQKGKYLADIYWLARQRLQDSGIAEGQVYGGGFCTLTDEARFFSYRRTPETGRMASLVWLHEAD